MKFMEPRKEYTWVGKSGKEYLYKIYTIEEIENNPTISGTSLFSIKLHNRKGNYIFAKHHYSSFQEKWKVVYIGQGILEDRIDLEKRKHKVDCINLNDATHVHFHDDNHANDEKREEEEKDLISNPELVPACNDTFKKLSNSNIEL
ncbi:MAG: hypothetical protein ACNYPH_07035 [Gammaproteobacteria bacterium WSBS_2016_MAG_OTU1]